MINSVIACLFLFVFGAVLFVVNATAPFSTLRRWGQPRGDLGLPAFFMSRRAVGHSGRGTWCPSTKEQGLAGRGAPRPGCLGPLRLEKRGAWRRRNKGLRGEAHHARPASGPNCPRDVVLIDEGTRACGERRTTSGPPSAHPARGTWCSSTKEQGLAGRGAPRPARRRPIAAPTGPKRTNRLDQQKEILL